MKLYTGDKDDKCPYYGKLCVKVCPTCKLNVLVRGTNPQTGDPVDVWDCVLPMLAMLTIENSQQQRQTGAAVESFRNEMVKSNAVGHQLLAMSGEIKRIGHGDV